MRSSHRLALLLTILTAVALVAGCSSDKPKTPTQPPATPVTPAPPQPGAALAITTSAGAIPIGSTDPVQVTVSGRRTDNGTALPDGTAVTLRTTLGGFNSPGGAAEVNLTLVGGRATAALFPANTIGIAMLRAEKPADGRYGFAFAEAQVRFVEREVTYIQAVSPNVGSPNGGEIVEVLGGGFESPVRVVFGSAPAVVRAVSESRITVETPQLAGFSGTPTPVAVQVTARYGAPDQRSDSLANGFTYAASGGTLQPLVLSVTPASGPNEGGTNVVINGDGFEAPVQVFFGDREAMVRNVTRTRIEAVSPPRANPNSGPTPVDIRVVNLNSGLSHTLKDAFRYGTAMFISSFGPGESPFSGGVLVTIYGQGFAEPVAASLANYAQQVVSVSGTQVVVRTVAIPVTSCPSDNVVARGPAAVTNIETGEGATTQGLEFMYTIQKPLLFGLAPTSGPQAGNTTVTLTGANFRAPVAVDFTVGSGTYTGIVQAVSGCDANGYCTTITVRTPALPNSAFGDSEDCDDNGDGYKGKKWVPVNASVLVRSLETGCDTKPLSNAFLFTPTDGSCRNDVDPNP